MTDNLLVVWGLKQYYPVKGGIGKEPSYVKAVDNVDFAVRRGEVFGIVGESGCKFHTRCPMCMERCKTEAPQKYQAGDDHFVYCHLYDTEEAKRNAKAAENAVIHQ